MCGRQSSYPHYLRFTQPRVLGRKVSDKFPVPLCRIHLESCTGQRTNLFGWTTQNIEPIGVARKLWNQTYLKLSPSRRSTDDSHAGATVAN